MEKGYKCRKTHELNRGVHVRLLAYNVMMSELLHTPLTNAISDKVMKIADIIKEVILHKS